MGLISRSSFRYRPHEAAKCHLLFQSARPNQLIVPYRNIRAAVAHAQCPITEDISGLDNGDRLKVQSLEKIEGVRSDRAEIILRSPPYSPIQGGQQQHGFGMTLDTGFCVGQVSPVSEVMGYLGQLHELWPHIAVNILFRSDAPGQ